MSELECPNPQQLADFAAGRVPEPLIDRISGHLEQCESCARLLDEIESGAPGPLRSLQLATAGATDPTRPQTSHLDVRSEKSTTLPAAVPDDDVGGGGWRTLVDRVVSWSQVRTGDLVAAQGSHAGDSPPKRLGQYELGEKLGEGAVGTVYRAVHQSLKREVVIKLLKPGRVLQADAVQRFYREMEAIGKLNHPNLIQATDAGEIDGTPYLVMEYAQGRTLSDVLREQRTLARSDACDIIRQAACGLHHAHEQGLIHRDIKPSNLLITDSGQVKILDLGLALVTRLPQPAANELLEDDPSQVDSQRVTRYGTAIGTRTYMAPEQWVDSHNVDRRADIYSLGCVFYRMLTGGHAGLSSHSGMEKTDDPVSSTSHYHPLQADDRLRPVLNLMLALDPDKRFQTAQEVVDAVSPFSDTANVSQLLEHAPPDAARWSRPMRFAKSKRVDGEPALAQEPKEAAPSVVQPVTYPVATRHGGSLTWLWVLTLVAILVGLALLGSVGLVWMTHEDSLKKDDTLPRSFGPEPASERSSGERLIEPASSSQPLTPHSDDSFLVRMMSGSSLRLFGTRDIVSPGNSFTLEFWVRDGGGMEEQTLVGTGEANWQPIHMSIQQPLGWRLTMRPTAVTGAFKFYDESNFGPGQRMGIPGGFPRAFGAQPAGDGEWHHVAVMRGDGQWIVAVDGAGNLVVPSMLGMHSDDFQTRGLDLAFGGDVVKGFEGDLRGVRLSQGIRYPELPFQVPYDFELDETTVALLDFSKGQGNVIPDLTGNGHEGRLRGGAWLPAMAPAIPGIRIHRQMIPRGLDFPGLDIPGFEHFRRP